MSKVHIVKLIENYTNYGLGEAGKMYHSAPHLGAGGVEFRIPSQYNRGARFVLSFYDANCVGREVTGGPVSQGAKAYFGAQATVIASTPIAKPPVLDVAVGDYIVDPALDLIVKVLPSSRAHDPKAEVITCQAATVDYSELVAAENAKPPVYVSEAWLSG